MSDFLRERIPFEEAISERKLLGKAFSMLSRPQQVVVKAFYGLPLQGEELDLWSAFQGYGEHDDLGYLSGVSQRVPYHPKEYDTLTGVIGRRSGKSDRIGGIIAAYEITLGGHTEYIRQAAVDEKGKKIAGAEGQEAFWLYIAQDLQTATINMRFVVMALDESPLLSKYILKRNADEIPFKNGIILRPEPPNIRTGRGVPVIGMTMDEFAFWYKDSKSANPDYEVVRALEYSLSQFPNAKQLRLSTPWTKEGLHYKAHTHGTEGRKLKCEHCADGQVCTHVSEDREEYEGHLVVEAPTAMMGNPQMTRKRLIRLRKRDPEAFARESLAKFTDSQTSFLTWSRVEGAIDRKVKERVKLKEAEYVAALDPAFRHDSFILSIGHHEKTRGVVQDYAKEWEPPPGEKLNPAVVLDEIKLELDKWGISHAYSDQYHLESLQVLAEDRDFTIVGYDLTTKSKAKIMNNLSSLTNQGKLRLLDIPNQESQLKSLIRTLGPAGYVSIAAPLGKKDDFATALALMVTHAQMMPAVDSGETAGPTGKGKFIDAATLSRLKKAWDLRMQHDAGFRREAEKMQTLWALFGDQDDG